MTFAQFIDIRIIDVINGTIIPGIFTLAFLAFLWGVSRYIFAGEGKDDIEKGRQIMIWGIIIIAIMMSLWGILRVFKYTITNGTSGSSFQQDNGSPQTIFRDVTNTADPNFSGGFSGNPETVYRDVTNTVNPEPEGFFDWALNCFGACRSSSNPSQSRDLNFGSTDSDLPGSDTPL